ncbi:hypothetical protein N9D66_00750 [Candidatus Nanopelagicales bacterium]|nr:hypothetical protein [Candidatus Nanopelagicales bacterium]
MVRESNPMSEESATAQKAASKQPNRRPGAGSKPEPIIPERSRDEDGAHDNFDDAWYEQERPPHH